MYFLGIDPDLSTTAVACCNEDLTPASVSIIRSAGGVLSMICAIEAWNQSNGIGTYGSAAAIEGQELYQYGKGRTKDPRDILHLAQVAGACWTIAMKRTAGGSGGLESCMFFPRPAEWKGQLDKLSHHRRICLAAGIPASDQIVMGGKDPYISMAKGTVLGDDQLNAGDWKHAMDALGLAQYAAKTYLDAQKKRTYLNEARHI